MKKQTNKTEILVSVRKKSNLLLIILEILLQCMEKIIDLSVDEMKT